LKAAGARTEFASEGGKGDVDDQVVDHDEEHTDAEDREHPPPSLVGAGLMVVVVGRGRVGGDRHVDIV